MLDRSVPFYHIDLPTRPSLARLLPKEVFKHLPLMKIPRQHGPSSSVWKILSGWSDN
jgi:hypothetical protein